MVLCAAQPRLPGAVRKASHRRSQRSDAVCHLTPTAQEDVRGRVAGHARGSLVTSGWTERTAVFLEGRAQPRVGHPRTGKVHLV